ncbi:MAG: NADH-quinone oxidoreductase subunit J [Anaerolineae bacterium]|nr:NADH-quinone oxidoreductase subunit J [Anaerolineae bacterium]
MEMVIFFILAVLAVVAGIAVVAQRSAVRSALFLLLNFCSLAGLYILLNAQFVAMVQIILYAGAVVVLFLFVVMLLGMERAEESPDTRRYQAVAGGLLAVLLLGGVVWALVLAGTGTASATATAGSVRSIGAALVGDFAVPFELASVVLLVAIVGAVVLAKAKLEE